MGEQISLDGAIVTGLVDAGLDQCNNLISVKL
jgi:hypothetical protein